MPKDLTVNLIKLPKYKAPEDIVKERCEHVSYMIDQEANVNDQKPQTT